MRIWLLVVHVSPQAGETVFGDDFTVFPGGKGANQAVACAKLGANVRMVGCVGNDANGRFLLDNFLTQSVDIENVRVLNGIPSGVAPILIAENDNMIVVVPGANGKVTCEIVDSVKEILLDSDIVLLQLEIPMATVEYSAAFCYKNHIPVILNPTPAQQLSKKLIKNVAYITPNEIEITQIFNDSFENVISDYPNKVIMTAGSMGTYFHDGSSIVHIPAHKVEVLDTTGAGDTFNGALAFGICEEMSLQNSIAFASKATSYSIKKLGAQSAMPTRIELEFEESV